MTPSTITWVDGDPWWARVYALSWAVSYTLIFVSLVVSTLLLIAGLLPLTPLWIGVQLALEVFGVSLLSVTVWWTARSRPVAQMGFDAVGLYIRSPLSRWPHRYEWSRVVALDSTHLEVPTMIGRGRIRLTLTSDQAEAARGSGLRV